MQQFAGFLPSDKPTPLALTTKVQQVGAELLSDVQTQFNPVNDPSTGGIAFYIVGDSSGVDVYLSWQDLAISGGKSVFGYSPGPLDRDTSTLQQYLPDNSIPEAAKEYVFSQSLNLQPTATVTVGFFIHAQLLGDSQGNVSATFAQYVANTVSHELGHTFGLVDSYFNGADGYAHSVAPLDVMRAGSPLDPFLTF
jgi:hypothetical protein